MARLVILANSIRHDGRCIGGIDLETGEWVRPVTRDGDGIPVTKCFVTGKLLAVRDILEVDLIRPRKIEEFQKENCIIRNWKWQVKRRLKLGAVSKYVDATTPVLHSTNDRVDPTVLRALPVDEWTSLQLVKPRKLSFSRHYYSPNRWVANFQDSANNWYEIKVSDPETTRRLESGEKISKRSLLTVSMTKPWTHNAKEKPAMCWKVVAAVIELDN